MLNCNLWRMAPETDAPRRPQTLETPTQMACVVNGTKTGHRLETSLRLEAGLFSAEFFLINHSRRVTVPRPFAVPRAVDRTVEVSPTV